MKLALTALLTAGFLVTPSAHAALVTTTMTGIESDFQLGFGSGSVAPVDPYHFSFSVTFDTSSDIFSSTAGLTFSDNMNNSVAYNYNKEDDFLTLATSLATNGCFNPFNSACMFVLFASRPNPLIVGYYLVTSDNSYWIGSKFTAVAPSPAPEPASWAMMLAGLGAIGGAMRSRRQAAISFS